MITLVDLIPNHDGKRDQLYDLLLRIKDIMLIEDSCPICKQPNEHLLTCEFYNFDLSLEY